jgi:hypothetical protein
MGPLHRQPRTSTRDLHELTTRTQLPHADLGPTPIRTLRRAHDLLLAAGFSLPPVCLATAPGPLAADGCSIVRGRSHPPPHLRHHPPASPDRYGGRGRDPHPPRSSGASWRSPGPGEPREHGSIARRLLLRRANASVVSSSRRMTPGRPTRVRAHRAARRPLVSARRKRGGCRGRLRLAGASAPRDGRRLAQLRRPRRPEGDDGQRPSAQVHIAHRSVAVAANTCRRPHSRTALKGERTRASMPQSRKTVVSRASGRESGHRVASRPRRDVIRRSRVSPV